MAIAVEVDPFESAPTIDSLIARTLNVEPEGVVFFKVLESSEERGSFSSNVWCVSSLSTDSLDHSLD